MKRDLGSSSLSGRKNLIFLFLEVFRHPRGAGKEREGMMKKYIL